MRNLIYFADPMCSWCWGFSPVIDRLAHEVGDRAPVVLVMGGLSVGTSQPLDASLKASIRRHWEHVHEASGQPFDPAFFDRQGFVYDTEPPSRAVVTARLLQPETALPFLARVHRAFYADNRDVTDPEVLLEIGGEHGFDRETFRRKWDDPDTHAATQADFFLSQRLGIRGFPTLLGRQDQQLVALTMGYRPWDDMEPIVSAWLDAAPSSAVSVD